MVKDIKSEEKLTDWEVVLNCINPKSTRPRRMSLHTLASVTGRTDIMELAKELEASGKVVGYRCPDVQALIFYLKDLCKLPGMIDTRNAGVWKMVPDFIKEHPFPKVKGFKRFAGAQWTGGTYGKGEYIRNSPAMEFPFEPEDFPYARVVVKALEDAGYTPGIEVPDDESVHDECCGGLVKAC